MGWDDWNDWDGDGDSDVTDAAIGAYATQEYARSSSGGIAELIIACFLFPPLLLLLPLVGLVALIAEGSARRQRRAGSAAPPPVQTSAAPASPTAERDRAGMESLLGYALLEHDLSGGGGFYGRGRDFDEDLDVDLDMDMDVGDFGDPWDWDV